MFDGETKIYRKMSVSQKIKIASQMYLLGKKLTNLNNRKIYGAETKSNRRSRNSFTEYRQDFE